MSAAGIAPQTLNVPMKDLTPWTPAVDARRLEKAGIITGRNFLNTVDGPLSAWSNDLVNWNHFNTFSRQKVSELRVGNDILYGMNDGLWRINQTSGLMELLLPATVAETFWPWSVAYVGGVYYIAQYDIGLWEYDPSVNSLIHITTPAGNTIRGVAESAGRLLALSDTHVLVSAQDNGANLIPNLLTAAQAQPLSLVGGIAYKIEVIPDGVLVYTSNGIMKGTVVQQAYVFQWTVLKSRVKIFSPNAACYIPKVGAIALDNSGFSLTKEYNYQDYGISVPWEPLMGEYIRKNILKNLDQTKYGVVDLHWSEAEQKLFVSFSSNVREGLMISGFVWDILTKTWGSFDHQNTGIFDVYNPTNNIYSCGFMATDGFMRKCTNSNVSQALPPSPVQIQDLVFRTVNEEPILAEVDFVGDTYHLGTTEIYSSNYNPNDYRNFFSTSGLFEINWNAYSDTNIGPPGNPDMELGPPIVGGSYIDLFESGGIEEYAVGYTLPQEGLNALVQVGPFRFNDQAIAGETSALAELLVGLSAATNFTIQEDWQLLDGEEDWNSLSGSEDWGEGNATPNSYQLVLRSSPDGINAPIWGDEDLYVWSDLGSAHTYRPIGYDGLWHLLTFKAIDPGEAFAIKTLDFTGILTGRMDSQ